MPTGFRIVSVADIPDRDIIHDGQRWGPWQLRCRNYTLVHTENGYEIDLEECCTSSQILDWIIQVHDKTWGGPVISGYLVAAFSALLDPQAHLCSRGRDGRLTVTQLKEMIDRYKRGES